MTIDASDPRLTAYALGELDEGERQSVEQEVRSSPALQREVEEIRLVAGVLAEELKKEQVPQLSPARLAVMGDFPAARPAGRRFLRVALALAAGLLLAAGVISLLSLLSDRSREGASGGTSGNRPPAGITRRPDQTPGTEPSQRPAPREEVAVGQPLPQPYPEGTPGAPAQEQMTDLVLELPGALYDGTPKNVKEPNLRPARKGPRPTLMVPVGTRNLALKKSVTGSDSVPIIGDLQLVTDGDKEGTDGSYVELGYGLQWVQIDLGEPCRIYAVVVWHYHREARIYRDVVVQVSDDADFITNVRTLFNNDIDNSAGLGIGKDQAYFESHEGEVIDAKAVKARYVRLYSRGNTSDDQNHYTEVEVWGKGVK